MQDLSSGFIGSAALGQGFVNGAIVRGAVGRKDARCRAFNPSLASASVSPGV